MQLQVSNVEESRSLEHSNDATQLGALVVSDPVPGILPGGEGVVACLVLDPLLCCALFMNARRAQDTAMIYGRQNI